MAKRLLVLLCSGVGLAAAASAATFVRSSPKVIAGGVPLLNEHLAFAGREQSDLTPEELSDGRWTVYLKTSASDMEAKRLCDAVSCDLYGRSRSRGGVRFFELRGTESDLSAAVKAANGQVGFVEPGNALMLVAADDKNGTASVPDKPPDSFTTPVMMLSFGAVNLVFAYVLINAIYRTCTDKEGYYPYVDWVWPSVVFGFVISNTIFLFAGVLRSNLLKEDLPAPDEEDSQDSQQVVLRTMGLALGWFFLTLLYQLYQAKYSKEFKYVQNGDSFVAENLYADLTLPMFKVAVNFMMQSCLCILLVYVAQRKVDEGLPDDMPVSRLVINLVISLFVQLYLFVKMKIGGTWEELNKLRYVEAIEQTSETEGMADDQKIHIVPDGDYWVRLIMLVLTKGIFNKFLILSYPLYIIPTDDIFDLVKDCLAITFVVEIDDLAASVEFVAKMGTDAIELLDRKKASKKKAENEMKEVVSNMLDSVTNQ